MCILFVSAAVADGQARQPCQPLAENVEPFFGDMHCIQVEVEEVGGAFVDVNGLAHLPV